MNPAMSPATMTTEGPEYSLSRKLVAEFAGSALLLATVVGSGVMGERLAAGNTAIALLANAIATGAALFALIAMFAPISGAHFNPLVTIIEAWSGRMSGRHAVLYLTAQVAGAVLGVMLAHAMFEIALLQSSQHVRAGAGQWLSEFIATFGLLSVILYADKARATTVAAMVACYITAAYWFTASTSFANPAVTLARSLTDTFSGIRMTDVPMFILAQVCGAVAAYVLHRWMTNER